MTTFVNDGPMHQRERPDIFGSRPPYRQLAERPDVLVFQSEVLTEPVEVTGPIRVHLWISSSARDTDVTAKLVDVYPASPDVPEGFQMNIVDSIQRMRFREGYEEEKLIEPGTVYPVTVILPPTSNVFAAGHRIRVDIASSSFPQFDVNPNTGEPLGRHTHTVRALNTIHLGGDTPSHIVLPIVPIT